MCQMNKQIVGILFIFVIIFNNSIAIANVKETKGRFSILNVNEKAPFDGVLYDPVGNAFILTKIKLIKEELILKLSEQKEELGLKYQLEIDKLNLKLQSEIEKSAGVIQEKDKEIIELRKLASNQEGTSYIWWVIGGVVTGTVLTLGTVYVVNEITK